MARKHSDADFCLTNEDRYPFAQLSDILVRNSPEIDRLNTVYLCVFQPDVLLTQFGYGRPLGLALLENTESTKVTHLDLQPLTFFTYGQADLKETIPMMEYIRTSQTLQSLNLENLNVEEYLFYTSDGDNEDGISDYDEIMDFVSQDSFWSNQSSLKEQVLLAAASNANLVTFTAKVALPVEELARFLRATTSVQEFNLDWRCYKDLCESTAATSPIAEAFVANQSIRQLSLKCKWEDFTLANQVLQRLDARNYFHCAVFIEVWHSYPNDLTLSSTTVLVSLQLVDMELDEDFVEQLSLNRSIERLELPGCSFLDAAAGAFVSFVQTRANQHGNRVRELRLNINNNPFPDMDVALDSAISAMIIGSALHSLELGNCTFLDSGSFFESLAADAKRICLQRLRVTSYVDYHPAIAQFLVKTTSLREFVIRLRDPNADALVRALQANCSLYTVSFVAEGTSILSSERQRLVEAYCERNQNLPELLQRLARPPVVLAMENAGSGTTRTIDEHSSNMRQFPPLFVAASPTPQTAAHNLVRGLLSMSEAFTRPDGVRSRADS